MWRPYRVAYTVCWKNLPMTMGEYNTRLQYVNIGLDKKKCRVFTSVRSAMSHNKRKTDT